MMAQIGAKLRDNLHEAVLLLSILTIIDFVGGKMIMQHKIVAPQTICGGLPIATGKNM